MIQSLVFQRYQQAISSGNSRSSLSRPVKSARYLMPTFKYHSVKWIANIFIEWRRSGVIHWKNWRSCGLEKVSFVSLNMVSAATVECVTFEFETRFGGYMRYKDSFSTSYQKLIPFVIRFLSCCNVGSDLLDNLTDKMTSKTVCLWSREFRVDLETRCIHFVVESLLDEVFDQMRARPIRADFAFRCWSYWRIRCTGFVIGNFSRG